jgi:hypothetical protein
MNVLSTIALILVIISGMYYVFLNSGNFSMKMLMSPGVLCWIALLLLSINFVSENYDPATDFAGGWPTARNSMMQKASKCAYNKSSSILPSCINTQEPKTCPSC